MKTGLAQRVCVRLLWCALSGALVGAIAGCAGTGASGKQELATASDETASQKRAGIRMQLAIGYYERGQYDVALDQIKLALAADPSMADGYGVRALIYLNMNELDLAEDNFQRALKLAPTNPDLANNYGSFLCSNGRPAQGMPYFESALKNRAYQSPVKALNNAGSCALKLKNNALAERYLLEALNLDPDIVSTNANMAQVYFERRDYTRAGFYINRVRTTAKLDSLSAEVLWLAIKVERKLGEKDGEAIMVTQLRRHHAGSPEFAAFQRGAFDE